MKTLEDKDLIELRQYCLNAALHIPRSLGDTPRTSKVIKMAHKFEMYITNGESPAPSRTFKEAYASGELDVADEYFGMHPITGRLTEEPLCAE